MMRYLRRNFLAVTYGFLLFSSQSAYAVTVRVVDQNGTPLPNAVIEWGHPSNASALEVAVVDQVDKSFKPELKVIMVGQEVSFPNSDNIRHHVYSFSEAKVFQLKLYAGTPKDPVRFDQPGVVVLGCNIHDSMVGYIYIAQTQYGLSNSRGEVDLPYDIPNDEISLWHANQVDGPENVVRVNLNDSGLSTGNKIKEFVIRTSEPQPRDTFRQKFRAGSPP